MVHRVLRYKCDLCGLTHMTEWLAEFCEQECADEALAAATGTAKTLQAAECEASQSGGSASERNAQTQSSTPDNKDKPNA